MPSSIYEKRARTIYMPVSVLCYLQSATSRGSTVISLNSLGVEYLPVVFGKLLR